MQAYIENVIVAPQYRHVAQHGFPAIDIRRTLPYEVMYTLVIKDGVTDSTVECVKCDNRDAAIAFAESLRVEYKILD